MEPVSLENGKTVSNMAKEYYKPKMVVNEKEFGIWANVKSGVFCNHVVNKIDFFNFLLK